MPYVQIISRVWLKKWKLNGLRFKRWYFVPACYALYTGERHSHILVQKLPHPQSGKLIFTLFLKIPHIQYFMCTKHESSAFMAFAKSKCPRCRSGKLFTHSFYSFGNFLKNHEHCPYCNLKFEKETGFFWAAMYISYGINVVIALVMGISLSIIFNDPSINTYVYSIVGVVVFASTLIFRYARMIALYTMSGYKYDSKYAKK